MVDDRCPPGDITRLLRDAGGGDNDARDELFRVLYDEIRANAGRERFVGRYGDTLQPTALAHEAYVEIVRRFPTVLSGDVSSRRQFFYALGLVMKTILRDHSRKGGKNAPRMVSLGTLDPAEPDRAEDIDGNELVKAIDVLEGFNPRWAGVVHYRFFADQTVQSTADLLGVSERLVVKDWSLAKAWLHRHLRREGTKPDCCLGSTEPAKPPQS